MASEVRVFSEYAKTIQGINKEEMAYFDIANDIADQIYSLMENNKINKSELATRLGSSRALVTKMLRGDSNLTLKTIAKVVSTLDGVMHVCITSQQKEVRWFELIRGDKHRKIQGSQKVINLNYETVNHNPRPAKKVANAEAAAVA